MKNEPKGVPLRTKKAPSTIGERSCHILKGYFNFNIYGKKLVLIKYTFRNKIKRRINIDSSS
ncbi:hypothetical protein EMIT079MI2_110194 [Bacillus sp. IT-79MI2]